MKKKTYIRVHIEEYASVNKLEMFPFYKFVFRLFVYVKRKMVSPTIKNIVALLMNL